MKTPNPNPESTPNFHDVNEQRKALRYVGKELGVMDMTLDDESEEKLKELNQQASEFKPVSISQGKNILREHEEISISHTKVDMDAVMKNFTEEESKTIDRYHGVATKLESLRENKLKALKKIHENPLNRDIIGTLVEKLNAGIDDEQSLYEKLKLENPDIFRALTFIGYKKDLSQEGHIIETPEVVDYIEKIEERVLSDKPIFIHGPTGTGKTSLAKRASKNITGKSPQMVFCNPNLRQSDVWGSKGIEPVKENPGAIRTVDIYGPLTRAMHEGCGVIFDEFNLLGDGEMAFLKGVLNAKVDDEINIPGNGKIKIQKGFHLIFSANLKSEKHQDRREIPNEMLREFAQNNIEIGYQSLEESYDIFMTRILDIDGSLELSDYDLEKTIPQLVRAIVDIQDAYAYKENGLKKLVMTQGDVDAITGAWKMESVNSDRSFLEFIDKRLQIMLTFKEYPEEDRVMASKLLVQRGFLNTLTEADLDLPKDTFKGLQNRDVLHVQEKIELSKKVVKHNILDIAKLDPFDKRKTRAEQEAQNLLGDDEFGLETPESHEQNEDKQTTTVRCLRENAKEWGWSQDQQQKVGKTLQNHSTPKSVWEGSDNQFTDTDPNKFGEASFTREKPLFNFEDTINYRVLTEKDIPSLQGIDFTTESNRLNAIRKFIDEIDKLNQESIKQTGKSKYYIPGLDYMDFLHKNEDKIPEYMKDGNYYFYPAASFRSHDGDLSVPCSCWSGSSLNRGGFYVGRGWGSSIRFLVLENI